MLGVEREAPLEIDQGCRSEDWREGVGEGPLAYGEFIHLSVFP